MSFSLRPFAQRQLAESTLTSSQIPRSASYFFVYFRQSRIHLTDLLSLVIFIMTNPQPIRDRFASPEYCNPDAKLPFIQSLRGENPSECGFFLSLDQMAKASWLNVPETLDSYTFSSGAVERGLIFCQPRMLVVPKSGLLAARTVKAENGNSELELLGNYRDFKGQSGVTNIQIFEVLLLDLDNYPLHEIPFQYIC